ncbi:hemin uptake protein HemP [Roseobacter sp. YSTF-M11]|uniref:Hemin uptake protein HemP n=1 Tax=Roseobacter insulae TaxID=2859783 RepID=A0A9X1FWU5_9RHOB|nr:hemin uptake protein HemP [Roseobacter insulae]MBW4709239.1 hemin uptake protein HemP [Roseobacter insulae]
MSYHAAKESTHTPVQTVPAYDASDLTKGGGLAQIVYQDKIYVLRITRAGKLILTK